MERQDDASRRTSPGTRRRKHRQPLLPREHGFWVMLAAVLLCASMQSRALSVALIATVAAVALMTALAGGTIRRRVRRSNAAQLASAALLAAAGVPVALVGRLPLAQIAATTAAWAVIFVANALVVHASLARAKRRTRRAFGFAALAVGGTVAASIGFALSSRNNAAMATTITAFGLAAIALVAPTTRQLKPVGIALAGVAALAALALAA